MCTMQTMTYFVSEKFPTNSFEIKVFFFLFQSFNFEPYENAKFIIYTYDFNRNNFNQTFIKTIVCNLYALTQ